MPAKSKKRFKPVIEEVVEEQAPTPTPTAEVTNENKTVELSEVETNSEEMPVVLNEPEAQPEVEVSAQEAQTKPKKDHKMNLKLVIVITVVSALVAAFVSGGVYVYLSGIDKINKDSNNEVVLEPTTTLSPTATPSPTGAPEEAVDISEFSVQVLNGSGAIGAAGAGMQVLEEAGFNVVSTSNAANYNFENTVVQAKEEVPAQAIETIRDALHAGDYEVEIGAPLTDNSEYDFVVTIGAN